MLRCVFRWRWPYNGNIFLKVNGKTIGITEELNSVLKYDIKKLRYPENILMYNGTILPEYLSKCTNLEIVQCRSGNLELLTKAPGLRILETEEGYNQQEFELLSNFTDLEILVIFPRVAQDEGLEVISGLTNLRELYVLGGRLTGEGFKNWDKLENLKKLHLANLVFPDEVYQCIAEIPNLTHLQIEWTSLTMGVPFAE